MKRPKKLIRLQFDVTPEELKFFDEVVFKLQAKTRAETFRRSIKLMDKALDGKLGIQVV